VRFLVRGDSGNVHLVAGRGLHVAAHELRRYPERSIFLDGVFVGPPFLDNERRQYALDHHHGVVRTFTLATCEQAAVLVALGLMPHQGTWHLYLNEPDLDAYLATWVLLQHDRLTRGQNEGLYSLVPLLRVEGHIDTHGLELPELTGLGPRRIAVERRRLERFRRAEVELRRRGEWATVDPLTHAAGVLETLDREFLPGHARAVRASASTRGDRASKVAVLICANVGIYEVEQALRIRYGMPSQGSSWSDRAEDSRSFSAIASSRITSAISIRYSMPRTRATKPATGMGGVAPKRSAARRDADRRGCRGRRCFGCLLGSTGSRRSWSQRDVEVLDDRLTSRGVIGRDLCASILR
jgi:hypothetical protein